MKSIRLIIATLIFAVAVSLPVAAQTGAQTGGTGIKVAIIDTAAFTEEKNGITKYISAYKQLETEFKPRTDELNAMVLRLQNLQKELDTLSKNTQTVDQASIQAKSDEGAKLQREYKFKQEELQSAIAKREPEVVGPIRQDIGNAMKDFMKQRSLDLVLDPNRDEKGMVIMWGANADITDEFIKFYNQRPNTAATTAPKPAATKPATAKP